MIQTVAVIGAGHLGRGFARLCADSGLRVVLEDVMPANLRRAQREFGPELGDCITYESTVEDAVREADLVVDFVPDELESKLEIFSLLDRMAPPRTILCTPSYALSITDLASCTYRPDRCFAVRASQPDLTFAESVQLLHPPAASYELMQGLVQMWQQLGKQVMVKLDCDVPMLVKNLTRQEAAGKN